MAPKKTHASAAAGSQAAEVLDRQIVMLAAIVIAGAIMPVLDAMVVNVSLETLGRGLHAALAQVQWVMTGYLLTLALVTPVVGWAADRLGAKRLWIFSLLLFAASSL